MIHRKTLHYLLALSSGLCLAGCAADPASLDDKAVTVVDTAHDLAFREALAVLARYHFRIAEADESTGLIWTEPLVGGQWFEIWRRDNASIKAFCTSNLHCIRRRARVEIGSVEGGVTVNCHVYTERLSAPPRQVTGSSQVYRLFSDSQPMVQSLAVTPEWKSRAMWVSLGEDRALARRIRLQLIHRRDAAARKL